MNQIDSSSLKLRAQSAGVEVWGVSLYWGDKKCVLGERLMGRVWTHSQSTCYLSTINCNKRQWWWQTRGWVSRLCHSETLHHRVLSVSLCDSAPFHLTDAFLLVLTLCLNLTYDTIVLEGEIEASLQPDAALKQKSSKTGKEKENCHSSHLGFYHRWFKDG